MLVIYLVGCLVSIIAVRILLNDEIKNRSVDDRSVSLLILFTIISWFSIIILFIGAIIEVIFEKISNIDWNKKIF